MRATLLEHLKKQLFRYFGVAIFVILGVWASFQLCLEVGASGCGWLQEMYRNRPSVVASASKPGAQKTSSTEAAPAVKLIEEEPNAGTKVQEPAQAPPPVSPVTAPVPENAPTKKAPADGGAGSTTK